MKHLLSITLLLFLYSQAIYAEELKFDISKSSVKWEGKKLGSSHKGDVKLKSATVKIENDKISKAEFIIDMNTITCEDIKDEKLNKKFINHLKSVDFFEVEKFPISKFKMIKSEKQLNATYNIIGEFTIKGITHKKEFSVKEFSDKFKTKIEIDRSMYNIRYGSKSFFKNLGDKFIHDVFKLEVELVKKKD